MRVRVEALRELSRLDEAEEHLTLMLTLTGARQVSQLNHARAQLAAGALRLAQGRSADALTHVQQALSLLAPSQVPESPLLQRAREMERHCSAAVLPPTDDLANCIHV
jgi:tetratricopeptide (TPR) repeat protein